MSRLSMQSVATTFSEVQSTADVTADHDDSVMTTASSMTQGGTKKAARGRKAATTAKARKTRAKKEEAVEILEDEQDTEAAPPPPPKATRGRKRGSDAVEDPEMTKAEAPAPKKRATRGKVSEAVGESAKAAEDADPADAPAPPAEQPVGKKKGRASTTKATTRKASATSLKAKASTASLRAQAQDDDQELERQLQADLERPLTDEEYLTADSESERKKAAPAPTKGKKAVIPRKPVGKSQEVQSEDDYAMFNPAPVHKDDEAEVDAELKALEAEMNAEPEPEPEQLEVPKKGRKAAGTRKVSKQTKKAKEAALPPPPPAPVEESEEDPIAVSEAREPEDVEDHDITSGTVVNKAAPSRPSTGRPRGRPKKSSTGPKAPVEEPQPEPQSEPNVVLLHDISEPEHVEPKVEEIPDMNPSSPLRSPDKPATPPAQATSPLRTNKSLPAVPPQSPPPPAEKPTPFTPRAFNHHPIAPTHSAKQATISPSQSPQSSDAENQPPSSRPAPTTTTKRAALAPSLLPATTPQRVPLSPSRRNVIGGTQSTQPWKAVDLDVVFALVGQQDGEGEMDRLLSREGKELSTPEQNMSVEEWVFYNANLAEEMLRRECEGMVGVFEKQGGRAMKALEGLVIE